ncbi:MAG: hypothetical protein ACHQIM_16080 [Sphingobacteriales bacterium]
MAKRVSLSGREKSIESIRGWYEDQMEAINDLRVKISSIRNEKFRELDLIEINTYFDNSEEELERLVCLDLISATEAFLRVDCYNRVNEKDKSEIGRIFREVHKKKEIKISLEEDIIEIWKNQLGNKPFSDFLGLLKYRHWLAHGRYWTPKLGRGYSFDIVYQITGNIFEVVSKQN